MKTDSPRDCPDCGAAMTLDRITPKLGPHPELLTFKCDGCGEVVTVIPGEDDRPDPET